VLKTRCSSSSYFPSQRVRFLIRRTPVSSWPMRIAVGSSGSGMAQIPLWLSRPKARKSRSMEEREKLIVSPFLRKSQ